MQDEVREPALDHPDDRDVGAEAPKTPEVVE
jgi:hypothetical protein